MPPTRSPMFSPDFWLTIRIVLTVGFCAAIFLVLDPFGWNCGSRSQAMRVMDASFLRVASMRILILDPPVDEPTPQTIADIIITGDAPADRGPGSSLDAETLRFGAHTVRQLRSRTLERSEIASDIAAVFPDGPPAWQTLGPITLCFDRTVSAHPELEQPFHPVIIGALVSHNAGARAQRTLLVALSDSAAVDASDPKSRALLESSLDASLAYYDSLGIPMPPEMVSELRIAIGAR